MAVGHSSTFLNAMRAEFSSVIPDWVKTIFLAHPAAQKSEFSTETSAPQYGSNTVTLPASWLTADPDPQDVRRVRNVDIVLPQSLTLHRKIVLPANSIGKLDKVIALDTVQKTPFKPADIYSLFLAGETSAGKVAVDQWIVRRDLITTLRDRFEKAGLRIRRIDVEGNTGKPLADFSSAIAPRASIWRWFNFGMVFVTLALLASLWAQPAWKDYSSLAQKTEELKDLKQDALALRTDVEALKETAAEKAEFLDRVVHRPLFLETLRAVTVALPDEVWITDLLFQRDKIVLRGSSRASAAQLVLDLTQTPEFGNPRLTGPVSQTSDGQERFDITLDPLGRAP